MTLKIYGLPASRAFRVLWAAGELGLSYENVALDYKGPEIKGPAYLAINPNGTVPAIVDDGFPLWESLAINLYLARKHGRLWPADVQGEGLAFQWTLWAATEVEPHIANWAYHSFFLPEAERKATVAAEAATALERRLGVLEGALARRDHLLGADFTIADLNLAAVLYRAPRFGLARWPRIADWHARCYARPAAKAAVALREAAAKA
jgi:glutathione S-transferase